MPLFGLGVIILWLGWFGFNPGSTLGALDGRFTEVLLVTQLAACAGVLGSIITSHLKTKTIDIGMAGNGAIGALTAHGLCGVWGTLSCGIFTLPTLAAYNAVGKPGLIYNGSFSQLGAQALGIVTVFSFVFAASFATFWLIKKTYGLRVSLEDEEAGLDISEHGMYGYPEQFIPAPELVGYGAVPAASRAPTGATIATPKEVPA
jgi:Amt family ammonium transporter